MSGVGMEVAARTGMRDLLAHAFCWTVFWIALFYAICFSPCVRNMKRCDEQYRHENCKFWIARNVIGIIHAFLIAGITVPVTFILWGAPDGVKYFSSYDLATCAARETDTVMVSYGDAVEWAALAGLAFTTFTFADLIVSLPHGLAAPDYIVHHLAFVSAGILIRGNCCVPFNACILLGMEVSTPFLNYAFLYRHRSEGRETRIVVAGVAFFILYVLWRMGLNSWGTVILWCKFFDGGAFPDIMPWWQAAIVLAAVNVGTGVQLFWFPAILKRFVRAARGGVSGASGDDAEDTAPSPRLPDDLSKPFLKSPIP